MKSNVTGVGDGRGLVDGDAVHGPLDGAIVDLGESILSLMAASKDQMSTALYHRYIGELYEALRLLRYIAMRKQGLHRGSVGGGHRQDVKELDWLLARVNKAQPAPDPRGGLPPKPDRSPSSRPGAAGRRPDRTGHGRPIRKRPGRRAASRRRSILVRPGLGVMVS